MNKMRDYLLEMSEVSETMVERKLEGDLEDLKNIVKELEITVMTKWLSR